MPTEMTQSATGFLRAASAVSLSLVSSIAVTCSMLNTLSSSIYMTCGNRQNTQLSYSNIWKCKRWHKHYQSFHLLWGLPWCQWSPRASVRDHRPDWTLLTVRMGHWMPCHGNAWIPARCSCSLWPPCCKSRSGFFLGSTTIHHHLMQNVLLHALKK